MNILFITHTRLGDAILSTCVLNYLHQTYPNAKLTIAAGPVAAPLFSSVPNLERLINVKKEKHHLHWVKLWSKCILHRWDMVVDLRGSSISFELCTKKRFYKYPKNSKQLHRVDRYAGLMKLDTITPPKLWIDAVHEQSANDILPKTGSIIAIAPAANWRAKTWRAERFAELIKALIAEDGQYPNATVLLIAAKHEREQVQPIFDALPNTAFIDLIGTQPLLTIAACIQRADIFVGNDSGLMHMAAAVGTRTAGLFGPGDPQKYGPYGPHCSVVTAPQTPDELMQVPGFDHRTSDTLMDGITVSDVVEHINTS